MSVNLEATPRRGLKELLDEYERSLILAALEQAGGHQRRAAALLDILPTTLHEKMKRLGLRPAHRDLRAVEGGRFSEAV